MLFVNRAIDALRCKSRTWYNYLACILIAEIFGYFTFASVLELFGGWADKNIRFAFGIIAATSFCAYFFNMLGYWFRNKYLAEQTLLREKHLLSTVLRTHAQHLHELVRKHHEAQRLNDAKSGITQSTNDAGLAATRITANTFSRVEFELDFEAAKGLLTISIFLALIPLFLFAIRHAFNYLRQHYAASAPVCIEPFCHWLLSWMRKSPIYPLCNFTGSDQVFIVLPFLISGVMLLFAYKQISRERMGGDEIAQKLDNENVTAIEYLHGRNTLRHLNAFQFADDKIGLALSATKGIRLALAKAYSWSGGANYLVTGTITLSMLLSMLAVVLFKASSKWELSATANLAAMTVLTGWYTKSIANYFALRVRKKKQNYANGLLLDLLHLPTTPTSSPTSLDSDFAFRSDNVTLNSADGHPVLQHLVFSIQKNEHVGLIGLSGAGKTTLIKALVGDILPTSGIILTNGVPTGCLAPSLLSKSIGYLPQKQNLFNATVRENISLSNVHHTSDNDIFEALKDVKLYESLMRRCDPSSNILDLRISANGENLSVGEMAKIAMARILVRDPDIWIIDEFDSALDEESKNTLLQLIRERTHNKTLLLVSHHPSDLIKMNVERIMVLDKMGISTGTPAELLRKRGLFSRLHALETGLDSNATCMTEDNFPPTQEGIREALQRSRLFAHLGWTQTAKLAKSAELVTINRGEILFQSNDPGDTMFSIISGNVEINGRTFGPGDSFGEIALFAKDARRTATVQCKTDCTFAKLSRAAVIELCEKEPSATIEILKATATIAARESDKARNNARKLAQTNVK